MPRPFTHLLCSILLTLPSVIVAWSPDRISLAAPDVLVLDWEWGELEGGRVVSYEAREGDKVVETAKGPAVVRENRILGHQVGRRADYLYEDISVAREGEPGRDWINGARWSVYSVTEEAEREIPLDGFYRKQKPSGMSIPLDWRVEFTLEHKLYFDLIEPLEEGERIQVRFDDEVVAEWEVDAEATRSDSIQVVQAGYDPQASQRYALLSTWMGDGGGLKYPESLRFHLVSTEDGKIAYTGEAVLARTEEEIDDDFRGIRPERSVNLSLSDVYRLDFSEFSEPGEYYIQVEGVGISYPFEISDAVWERAFATSMRGFYYQRGGVELEIPWMDFTRPANFSAEGGKTAFVSEARAQPYTVEETRIDNHVIRNQKEAFKKLPQYGTEEVITAIGGGYFDAGDWDRRSPHLIVTYRLLSMYELDPGYFEDLRWGIGSEDDVLPEILQEAHWGPQLFKALQLENGGIPYWLESEEHPNRGETSWTDSLDLYMTQPDAVSSYLYAATALKLARALEPYLPEDAADWKASAMRAMDFADAEWAEIPAGHTKMRELEDMRHLAALEAWLSTGEEGWHERVKASAVYEDPETPLRKWFHQRKGGERDQLDAAFLYATQTLQEADPDLREAAKQAILNQAEYAAEFTHENIYGYAKYDPSQNMGWGTLGAPQAKHLVMAWWLTSDQRYYDAAVLANNLPLGMNADQLSFTTGIGSKWPDHPLVIDFLRTGKMPPGITIYGTWNPKFWDSWGIQRAAKAGLFYPEYKEWPTSEGYVDIGYGNAGQAEYTVQHTMSYANTVWGFLSLERSPVEDDLDDAETAEIF